MTDSAQPTSLLTNHSFVDISDMNSMALSSKASQVIRIHNTDDILPTFKQLNESDRSFIIISSGSNIILPEVLYASVILPSLKGQTIIAEDEAAITLDVMAGENWHEFVVATVQKGWYGLENLALIPSWVGSSPVQNIGAYGVQVEDVIESVKAFHIPSLTWHQLSKADCKFSYRDSLFKQQPGQWLITNVVLKLSKVAKINSKYGDVASVATEFAQKAGRATTTPVDVMNAIIQIRQAKLPDPKDLPNCGSFFKNPIIPKHQAEQLLVNFPNLVNYPIKSAAGEQTDQVKIAAGWLIDQAGLKGKGIGPILTHKKQALVLTNHAPHLATQADVAKTMRYIQDTVMQQFGIKLEAEPVWIEYDGSIRQTH